MVQQDIHWVTGAALQALALQNLRLGDTFSRAQLKAWQPALGTGKKMKHATKKLLELGFVTSQQEAVLDGFNWQAIYTITAAGKAAIAGAGSGELLRSGPRGPHGIDRAVGPGTFVARLWRLMRARTILDAETAASTLVDAGDEQAMQRAAKSARRYFHRWASVQAITESRTRTSTRCKRYVLVKDSVQPPTWTPKALARQEGAA